MTEPTTPVRERLDELERANDGSNGRREPDVLDLIAALRKVDELADELERRWKSKDYVIAHLRAAVASVLAPAEEGR